MNRSNGGDSIVDAVREVFRVALPLMVSAGTFSIVLFADRTLLLWHDGPSMTASMAGGNLYWVFSCLPMGIVSMSGAIVSQYVGADEEDQIGRFMWQAVWLALAFTPFFLVVAAVAPLLFQMTGQPEHLVPLETTYLRILMFGAIGLVASAAMSGFFSGTERTGVIMRVSIVASILNFVLDLVLIFGFGPIPAMGIAGAAIGSVISFWFKAVCYGVLLMRPKYESRYKMRSGFGFDLKLLGKLFFYGCPTGLMHLAESGGFAVIVLRIGSLGDVPLRATTMAINFNMVAFIPLVGVSIAASVLVGRHLLQSGPARAALSAHAALAIGGVYSFAWLLAYVTIPDIMLSLYELSESDQDTKESIALASGLLRFVAIYFVLDAAQLIVAGALRGAGDTWFVLLSGVLASAVALWVGFTWEPTGDTLHWWWYMLTMWIWLLAILLVARFVRGRWKHMRMV